MNYRFGARWWRRPASSRIDAGGRGDVHQEGIQQESLANMAMGRQSNEGCKLELSILLNGAHSPSHHKAVNPTPSRWRFVIHAIARPPAGGVRQEVQAHPAVM